MPIGQCPCGEKSSPSKHYCLQCHAKYMREWRKSHPLKDAARLKMNARSYLHVYVKKGYIKKQPCEICGNVNVQGHHSDYNKPLKVNWLCKEHHKKIHAVTV